MISSIDILLYIEAVFLSPPMDSRTHDLCEGGFFLPGVPPHTNCEFKYPSAGSDMCRVLHVVYEGYHRFIKLNEV